MELLSRGRTYGVVWRLRRGCDVIAAVSQRVFVAAFVFGMGGCDARVFDAISRPASHDSDAVDTDRDTDRFWNDTADKETASDADAWDELDTEMWATTPPCGSSSPGSDDLHVYRVVGDGTAASCTQETIQTVLDEMTDDTTTVLEFNCPQPVTITLSSPLVIPENARVHIRGNNKVEFDGEQGTSLVVIEDGARIRLHGLSFVRGASDTNGGAIQAVNGIDSGSLIVDNCRFVENQAGRYGGALYAVGLEYLLVTYSVFEDNTAERGGAISVVGNTVYVTDSQFVRNSASQDGGAMSIEGNPDNPRQEAVAICGSLFDTNRATHHGSAIKSFLYGDRPARFHHLYMVHNETVSHINSYGTIYHGRAPLLLSASTFEQNTSASSGGALYLHETEDARIENCTFFQNEALGEEAVLEGLGGAVFIPANSEARLAHCTFVGNESIRGPAINAPSPQAVTIWNTIFSVNQSRVDSPGYANHCNFLSDGGNAVQYHPDEVYPYPWCAAENVLFDDPLLNATPTRYSDTDPVPTLAITSPLSIARNLGTQACLATDARGYNRDRPCDAGAFEYPE